MMVEEPVGTPADLLAHSRTGWFGLVLAAVAVALGMWGGASTPSAEVDGYGIISALPAVYWLGVAVGALATGVLLRLAIVERTRYASVVPALWLAVLHTGPHLAHDHFRYHTAWSHVGLIRLIEEQRTADASIDGRLASPGFFGALVAPLARMDDAVLELAVRLWPTAILGATAILVSALASRAFPTVPLIKPLSAVVYVLVAWTGQDHLSPESYGFTAYLAILVLLESGPLRISPAWSSAVPFLPRFASAGGDRPASRSTPIFVVLLVLSLGAVVSHPLAPLFICLGLVILGLYGRTVAWRLLILVAVSYVCWFAVGADSWWPGEIGRVDELAAGLWPDTTSASPQHRFVTLVRSGVGFAMFAGVLAVGAAMAGERFRHLRPAVPIVPLAAVPAVVLALRSYGGGITSRAVLFALPMAAILIGRILAGVRVRTLPLVLPAVALVLVPLLLVARFGHEAFEMTTEVDRAAVQAGYDRARDDTLFVVDSVHAPDRDRSVGRNHFAEVPAVADQAYVDELERRAVELGATRIIVVLTPGQSQWRVHGLGSRPDHLAEVARWLKARPGATVLFERDGGWTIEL